MMKSKYFLVFLGGGLGSLLRYLLAAVLEIGIGSTLAGSLSLYLVNISGAVFLGITTGFKSESAKLFWGAGFAGGFTTMSGVAIFLYTQTPATALPGAAIMFGLGFIGYAAGANLARAIGGKK
jgi:fluoride ion exporter CrcB/FEX